MRTRQVDRKRVTIEGQCCSVQGRPFDVTLEDLTTGGCGFADPENVLAIGTPVNLMIAGTGPHRAHVRWKSEGKVGVSFQRALTADEVKDLIEGRPAAPAPSPKPSAPVETGESPQAPTYPLRSVC